MRTGRASHTWDRRRLFPNIWSPGDTKWKRYCHPLEPIPTAEPVEARPKLWWLLSDSDWWNHNGFEIFIHRNGMMIQRTPYFGISGNMLKPPNSFKYTLILPVWMRNFMQKQHDVFWEILENHIHGQYPFLLHWVAPCGAMLRHSQSRAQEVTTDSPSTLQAPHTL